MKKEERKGITVSTKESDRKMYEELAEYYGMTVSGVIRHLALQEKRRLDSLKNK